MTGSIAVIVGVCTLIASAGGATVYLYKAYKFIKKPIEELRMNLEQIEGCLDRDKDKLEEHDALLQRLCETSEALVNADFAILTHMAQGNSTGKINEAIKDLGSMLAPKYK